VPLPSDFDPEVVMAEGAGRREERRLLAASELAEARALYSDEAGDPVLRPSFAVYLDGLGTKASILDLTDDHLRRQVSLLDRFRWFLHDDEWEGQTQRFLSFSDNVVLGVPISANSLGGYGLGILLGSIHAYQVNMTNNGLFLRGGIAAGDLYVDDRFVTGPALVDAVVIEEEVAIYPRVVLAPLCLKIVLQDLADYVPFESESPWNDQLLIDADGSVFLNYLPIIDDLPDGPLRVEAVSSGLRHHQLAVIENLERFTAPGRIREKYVWAAHYHNFVCREWFASVAEEFVIGAPLTEVEHRFARCFRRLSDPETREPS
jgi:hypothetical protein